LGLIAHESREMADLIEDLLIAARSEEGLVPVFPERTDLSLLATSVANRLSVPEDVTLDIADVESPAYADPVRVRQIIRNLLTNAIRYGGRAITVTAGGGDGVSFIEVHDDGAGIPEADRQRIFEPYGRSEASGVVAGSVGLGLALSKRLAELLSGTLEYRPGPGCTFRLTVPDHAPESVEA
ncbi:MAG: HAMP domain-containing histidine kinase, partial [Acidimicrobiia bacterium]|nr:HAMP domain-containing histidine kinase [Acidimicrobiia bacterium]